MKTMAEVIREATKRDMFGQAYTTADQLAAALTAAGYGPMKTTAEMAAIERAAMVWALRDAADHVSEIDGRPDDAARDWLRARAAAIEAGQ